MIGVNFDVTQRRHAEQALRERDAAERSSRAKSEFLARMSHELRTPLNAVLGFTQLIEHDGARLLTPQHLERISRIRTAGQHLLSLIEDMLDLSAVEAGKLPLAADPVALDEVIDDVWPWVLPLAERGRIALHRGVVGAWVSGDARRLRQVLANLLTNAVKYNRPGGNVWLEFVPIDGERCELTVRDDGRGLSDEQREHLFEPFNRLGAEQEGVEGVGLGLVVVRRLVEAMGGSIDVSSVLGRGTAMRLTLRAATAPRTASDDSAAAGSAGGGGPPLDILYIEDNPVNVLLVEELVALRPNMVLRSAGDGEAGVRAALADPPDVVLVDMQLPDFDGYEVLRRLRRADSLGDARVLALSANAMPEEVARARAAGFDDYWTKPLDFTRFLDGLDAIARARGLATA
jgi:CheY-like chemotaxis protein/nitrogen-specific signal transduction histidine kinase